MVTLDDVKIHLRIEIDDEDDYLESLIAVADAAVQDYCLTTFDDDVPEPVKMACMLMIGYIYENRDAPDSTAYKAMRMAFEALLYPYRDMEVVLG